MGRAVISIHPVQLSSYFVISECPLEHLHPHPSHTLSIGKKSPQTELSFSYLPSPQSYFLFFFHSWAHPRLSSPR